MLSPWKFSSIWSPSIGGQGREVKTQGQGRGLQFRGQGQGLANWSSRILEDSGGFKGDGGGGRLPYWLIFFFI